MGSRLDRYSNQAEALPVFLTIVPIALFLTVVLPEGLSLKGLLIKSVPFVGLVGLAFTISQIGADFGKRLEKRLWEQWGGPPTMRFLRHNNSEYNEITRHHVHEALRRLGFYLPTSEEQSTDSAYADTCYEACTMELKRRTRDKTKFPLVHKRLIDYGFRRNILGMKRFGLVISVATLLLCVGHIISGWDVHSPNIPMIAACVVTTGCIVGWFTLVTEKVVWRGANRYALALLEAARDLE